MTSDHPTFKQTTPSRPPPFKKNFFYKTSSFINESLARTTLPPHSTPFLYIFFIKPLPSYFNDNESPTRNHSSLMTTSFVFLSETSFVFPHKIIRDHSPFKTTFYLFIYLTLPFLTMDSICVHIWKGVSLYWLSHTQNVCSFSFLKHLHLYFHVKWEHFF